jgi:membrane dipeptidase
MDDDMLRAVAQNGGVVMVNFGASFVDQNRTEAAKKRDEILSPALKELEQRYANDPEQLRQARQTLLGAFVLPDTPLSKLIDHIDHIAKVAGTDHVGLGSDFDGVSALPVGMEDCSKLPNIAYELLKREYSETDIKKVLGENFLRVMARAEEVARQLSSGTKTQQARAENQTARLGGKR